MLFRFVQPEEVKAAEEISKPNVDEAFVQFQVGKREVTWWHFALFVENLLGDSALLLLTTSSVCLVLCACALPLHKISAVHLACTRTYMYGLPQAKVGAEPEQVLRYYEDSSDGPLWALSTNRPTKVRVVVKCRGAMLGFSRVLRNRNV